MVFIPFVSGRILDPLGEPLDGKPAPRYEDRLSSSIFHVSGPPTTHRVPSKGAFPSGVRSLDAFRPIVRGRSVALTGNTGQGQREFALQLITHLSSCQRGMVELREALEGASSAGAAKATLGKPLRWVYISVGHSARKTAETVEALWASGGSAFGTAVVADSTSPVGLQWMAPLAGISLAEAWRSVGDDVVVVLDDLATHLEIARQCVETTFAMSFFLCPSPCPKPCKPGLVVWHFFLLA